PDARPPTAAPINASTASPTVANSFRNGVRNSLGCTRHPPFAPNCTHPTNMSGGAFTSVNQSDVARFPLGVGMCFVLVIVFPGDMSHGSAYPGARPRCLRRVNHWPREPAITTHCVACSPIVWPRQFLPCAVGLAPFFTSRFCYFRMAITDPEIGFTAD